MEHNIDIWSLVTFKPREKKKTELLPMNTKNQNVNKNELNFFGKTTVKMRTTLSLHRTRRCKAVAWYGLAARIQQDDTI